MGDGSLTAYEIAVVAVLSELAVDGVVEIGTRQLAPAAGMSRDTAIRVLRRLRTRGVIKRIEHKDEWGNDLASRYRIVGSPVRQATQS